MAASFFVNLMQVEFESVLAVEHTGMVRMFNTLEDTGLKGFLVASGSVYESSILEFFANAKVITGTVISFIANRKLALTKDVFAEAFRLWAPRKKKEMKVEYMLLHDIVAKALCAKLDLLTWSLARTHKSSTPQIIDINDKNLTYLQDNVSSLDLMVERIKDDTIFARHSTVQLRRHLQTVVDGLEIKVDVLESTLARKFAENQQNLVALDNGLVRHFADSQQAIVDEVASLKSQVAEMVDCLK
ncbi:hypothetical protein F511_32863 [Dorcoceras hygrometricum]|uniref:Uncharacterized protein n=1 Tax=Dorcoceras hygrometricum TaxID=472368 RepID=A0A2Z7AQ31_9LAMI|nr:hypothetical protein F511_32863 [Dorcoceras hygrometricum]